MFEFIWVYRAMSPAFSRLHVCFKQDMGTDLIFPFSENFMGKAEHDRTRKYCYQFYWAFGLLL